MQFGGSDCSDELGVQSEESIAEMLGHVTKVLTHLTGGHNLFLLKGSQRFFVHKFINELHQLSF